MKIKAIDQPEPRFVTKLVISRFQRRRAGVEWLFFRIFWV